MGYSIRRSNRKPPPSRRVTAKRPQPIKIRNLPDKSGLTKVKKMMILHASRGRPGYGIEAAIKLSRSMKSDVPFTYYFSLDGDDPRLEEYRDNIAKLDFVTKTFINDNRGCVDATNHAAESHQNEDLIFNYGDDVGIHLGWDLFVLDFIQKHVPVSEYLIHFPNAAHNAKNCAIFQMMSGELYKRLGYIFYPEYISMSADVDLWDTCNRLGVVYNYCSPPNPHVFYHNHPALGGTIPWDDTYTRTNRPECYAAGGRVYDRRKIEGFPIK